MLKALVRFLWPPDAPKTQSVSPPDYVTRADLERELKRFEERTEFEFGEWYDKFSALHARAEKRVQRDKHNGKAPSAQLEIAPERTSALSYRKPWSV